VPLPAAHPLHTPNTREHASTQHNCQAKAQQQHCERWGCHLIANTWCLSTQSKGQLQPACCDNSKAAATPAPACNPWAQARQHLYFVLLPAQPAGSCRCPCALFCNLTAGTAVTGCHTLCAHNGCSCSPTVKAPSQKHCKQLPASTRMQAVPTADSRHTVIIITQSTPIRQGCCCNAVEEPASSTS
jgi:hypothetical protein